MAATFDGWVWLQCMYAVLSQYGILFLYIYINTALISLERRQLECWLLSQQFLAAVELTQGKCYSVLKRI